MTAYELLALLALAVVQPPLGRLVPEHLVEAMALDLDEQIF